MNCEENKPCECDVCEATPDYEGLFKEREFEIEKLSRDNSELVNSVIVNSCIISRLKADCEKNKREVMYRDKELSRLYKQLDKVCHERDNLLDTNKKLVEENGKITSRLKDVLDNK